MASVILKGISMLISLFIVPITINYVNPVQYGIWLTLSSLMAWFYFFWHRPDKRIQKPLYDSESMWETEDGPRVCVDHVCGAVHFRLWFSCRYWSPVSFIVDWSSVLKVDQSYCEELENDICGSSGIFGLNIVFQTFSTMLIADQRSAFSSGIQVLGQGLALLVIFILTKTVKSGSITSLAFIFPASRLSRWCSAQSYSSIPATANFARISATYGSNMWKISLGSEGNFSLSRLPCCLSIR